MQVYSTETTATGPPPTRTTHRPATSPKKREVVYENHSCSETSEVTSTLQGGGDPQTSSVLGWTHPPKRDEG